MTTSDASTEPEICAEKSESEFIPIVRSGACTDIGFRKSMEDVCVCVDNLVHDYDLPNFADRPSAFYGVCPTDLVMELNVDSICFIFSLSLSLFKGFFTCPNFLPQNRI